MKFSKTTWIFLAVGIFIIALASLGMIYSQQGNEQSRLSEELALAQLRWKKYPAQQLELASQQEELESRLAKAEAELRTAKTSLRQSTESIEASDALFELAEDCYVEVTEISSPGVANQTLDEISLPALPLTVTVEGDVLNLIDFIYQWTHEYLTGVVKSVVISVPEPAEEEEAAAAAAAAEIEEQMPSATINMLIYTYEGN